MLLVGFLSLSLFVISLYGRFTLEMKVQRDRLENQSDVYSAPSGDIEYARSGHGQPVLIIHGAGGGYDQGLLLGKIFIPQAYEIISISRYGYLGTPLSDNPTPDNQVELYIALLNHLGYDSVHVVGVSDGGPSALKMSINHPDRVKTLTMIAAKSQTPPELTPIQEAVFGNIFNNDFLFWCITEFAKEELYTVLGVSKDVQSKLSDQEEKLAEDFLRIMHPISLRKQGILNANVQFKELAPEDYPLDKIIAPTLVIHARDDSLQPYSYADYTYNSINQAELLSYDQGGHMLFGHHNEIKERMKTFFSSNQ